MNPILPASQIASVFSRPGIKCIYAGRVNGAIVLAEVKQAGFVRVGNYDQHVDVGVLEEAADMALMREGL